MGFLAPVGKFLLGAIGGKAGAAKLGAGVGASILGSKLGQSSRSPLEESIIRQQSEANQLGMDTGKGLLAEGAADRERGRGLLQTGINSAYPALNYWSQLLAGNKSGMTSLLSPELNRISQGYNTARQTNAALNPRGGPRADILSEQPFQQQRDVSNLFSTIRPMAASNLLDTSRFVTDASERSMASGSSLLTQAINSIFAGQGGRNMLLSSELDRRAGDRESGRNIGSTLFDLLGLLGGKGGGSASNRQTDIMNPPRIGLPGTGGGVFT